ncbi:MAG: aminopeptidase P family N-terminal domain-containing protein [Saprospiraceae bacterium]|nr:aminopeptidase P family N-terminal domain-containing protein [Saprospiraceae bacterium]
MSNTAKVKALRAVMQNKGIAAVIIPTADPHQSEYPAECWKDREWISGFTGSAGVVVVGREVAGLWADSRYYLQAEEELKGGAITLFKVKNQFAPEHVEWLCETLTDGDEVAIDGEDISKSQYDQYAQMLGKKGIVLKTIDLVSEIWTDRPALPSAPAFLLEAPYPGNTRAEKLAMIRKTMREKLADHHLMTSLDDIAWTFNLRGRDVAFNPLVVAHALVSQTRATLYMDAGKLNEKSIAELAKDHIQIQPYSQIVADLNHLSAGQTVLVEAATINTTLYKAINGQLLHGDAPARIAKGVKTASEIEHLRATMVKDGVALVKAFKWLEDNLGKTTITEAGFGDIIAQFRSEQEAYQGESFNAIVGYQGNGAIVHYHPDHHNSAEIKPEGILLVDCGGQYLGGTTDITRTIALSKPDHQQQRH